MGYSLVRTFTAIAALCLCAGASQAALLTYGTQASFNAAHTGLALEDFQDVSSIAQVLAGTNITTGVSFSLTSGTNAYLAGPGQSSNPTRAIGVNTPSSAGWRVAFSTAVNAVSLDVFQNIGGGTQSGSALNVTVDVFGSSGLLGTFLASVPSGSAGFVGVFSTSDLITSMTVNNAFSYDVIDNVRFGQTLTSVPEPGSLALAGMALVGLARARRRMTRG